MGGSDKGENLEPEKLFEIEGYISRDGDGIGDGAPDPMMQSMGPPAGSDAITKLLGWLKPRVSGRNRSPHLDQLSGVGDGGGHSPTQRARKELAHK